MKTKLLNGVWLLAAFLTVGLSHTYAQTSVQGQPHPKATLEKGTLLTTHTSNRAQARSRANGGFSTDDILNWTGEGENEAYLAIQWSDERCTFAYVWGYRFNGTAKGIDMIKAICNEDPRLYFLTEGGTSYGSTISGIGYDYNENGYIYLMKDGIQIEQAEPGVFTTTGYDYDSFIAADGEDFWDAGWYTNGYWSYWVGNSASELGYSGLGASSRVLTDGSWDAWVFAKNFATVGLYDLVPAPATGSNYSKGTYLLGENADGSSAIHSLNKDNSLSYNLYSTENEGHSLGLSPVYGCVWGNSIYFVSEKSSSNGGRLVIANAKNLAFEASINELDGGDGHAFVGISSQKAYVSTTRGIVSIDLSTHTVVKSVLNDGAVGLMLKSGKYVYAVQQGKGVVIVDTESDTVARTFSGDFVSIAQTADGSIWAAATTQLVKINPQSWASETVALPSGISIYGDWENWSAGTFFADTEKDVLYWSNATEDNGGTTVYRFITNNRASLAYPFFTLGGSSKSSETLTAAGLRMDARTRNLVLLANGETDLSRTNMLYLVNADNGDQSAALTLESGNATPVLPVFPDKAPSFSSDIIDSYVREANADPIVIDLNGKISDTDNVDANIELQATSSHENRVVASLSNGVLTLTLQPNAVGSSSITVTATSNGQSVTKEIIVNILNHPKNISLDKHSAHLSAGYKDTLTVTFDPLDASDQSVQWTSSDAKVVSVNSGEVKAFAAGFVTAIKEGTATIYATSTDGALVDSCEYTVENRFMTGLFLSKDSIRIGVSLKDTLNVIYEPDSVSNANRSVQWTIADKSIASLSTYSSSLGIYRAYVTGKATGETYLYVTSKDGSFSDTCKISVYFIPADSIALNFDTVSITMPSTKYLSAKYFPEGRCSNTSTTWSVKDNNIATVSTSGAVKGVAAGTTWVYATSVDDATLKDSCFVIVNYTPVEGITLSVHELQVATGKSTSLSKTFTPTSVSNSAVTWSSDSVSIATVSTNGSVKGITEGSTWIRIVTTDGHFTDSCRVTVKDVIEADSIALNTHEFTLKVNGSKYIYRIAYPSSANTPATFYSGNDSVAVISGTSSVKAVGPGTTYVYVSMNGLVDSCLVTVYETATALDLNMQHADLIVNDTLQLTANIFPSTAIQEVTWKSSNAAVATVDASGRVVCLASGTAQIEVISNDVKSLVGICTVTVSEQQSQHIFLSSNYQKLFIGDQAQLTATVFPENTTNKRVFWISSDRSVADITSYGQVNALAAGTAILTCQSQDGASQATCKVQIDEVPRDTIILTEIVHDTLINIVHDTLINVIHDTLTVTQVVRDTLVCFVTDTDMLPAPSITVEDDIVTMGCMLGGAQIFYTTDGTLPDKNSLRYNGPFELHANCTLTAIALMESESSVFQAVLSGISKQGVDIVYTRYFNEAGIESTTPQSGLNIVRIGYSDGTEKIVKIRVK